MGIEVYSAGEISYRRGIGYPCGCEGAFNVINSDIKILDLALALIVYGNHGGIRRDGRRPQNE